MGYRIRTSKRGLGFSGLLTIVFIGLKLLGKIDWTWFWVFSPAWIVVVIYVIIGLLIILGILGISAIIKKD